MTRKKNSMKVSMGKLRQNVVELKNKQVKAKVNRKRNPVKGKNLRQNK